MKKIELSLYDTSIFIDDDCFDICDDIFDYAVAFGVAYDNELNDYYDKVLNYMAHNIICIKGGGIYKTCKISEFMDSHRKAFDKWMNNNYYESWQPQNLEIATIDDEEFYDIYIDLFNLIVCGNLSEEEYKELYEYLQMDLKK